MNSGVEIILQRMKDNPEDFYYHPNRGVSRWSSLLSHAFGENILTQEESDALKAGLNETKRVRFTELVMKELTGDNEDPKGVTLNNMAHPTATGTLGQGLRTSSTLNNSNLVLTTLGGQPTWGNAITATTLDAQAQQTAQLRAMIDELKVRDDIRKKEAKHETLFGRLKNYFHPEI
jgi:hypothetical protein